MSLLAYTADPLLRHFVENQATVVPTRAEVSDKQRFEWLRNFSCPRSPYHALSQKKLYLRFANADRMMARSGPPSVAAVGECFLKAMLRTRNWQWRRYIFVKLALAGRPE